MTQEQIQESLDVLSEERNLAQSLQERLDHTLFGKPSTCLPCPILIFLRIVFGGFESP